MDAGMYAAQNGALGSVLGVGCIRLVGSNLVIQARLLEMKPDQVLNRPDKLLMISANNDIERRRAPTRARL